MPDAEPVRIELLYGSVVPGSKRRWWPGTVLAVAPDVADRLVADGRAVRLDPPPAPPTGA